MSALLLSCLSGASAQAPLLGVGYYGVQPKQLSTASGNNAAVQAPPSSTLYGYNASGLAPGSAVYASGVVAVGARGSSCTVSFNSGSPTVAATGLLVLTGVNAVAGGSSIGLTNVGTGYASAPATAVAGNGTATCSGTLQVITALGAYAPLTVDSQGNLSAGALQGATIQPLGAGCLYSNGGSGPISWAPACGLGGSAGQLQWNRFGSFAGTSGGLTDGEHFAFGPSSAVNDQGPSIITVEDGSSSPDTSAAGVSALSTFLTWSPTSPVTEANFYAHQYSIYTDLDGSGGVNNTVIVNGINACVQDNSDAISPAIS